MDLPDSFTKCRAKRTEDQPQTNGLQDLQTLHTYNRAKPQVGRATYLHAVSCVEWCGLHTVPAYSSSFCALRTECALGIQAGQYTT